MNVILSFDNEYSFLSNFAPCEIEYEGLKFTSLEAAYQAAKCADKTQMIQFTTLTPGKAKKLGQIVDCVENWHDIKDSVMTTLLESKFSNNNPLLLKKLLATNGMDLVEGNTWNDTYWGVCDGVGQNKLGKLLVAVRSKRLQE